MTPTKQFSALLYALANQVRNRQAVMIPPERIEDAAERLDTLTVTIRGLEIQRNELLAALEEMVDVARLTIGWSCTPANADGPLAVAERLIANSKGGEA